MFKLILNLLYLTPISGFASSIVEKGSSHFTGEQIFWCILIGSIIVALLPHLWKFLFHQLQKAAVREGQESIINKTDTFSDLRPQLQNGHIPQESPGLRKSLPFLLSKNEQIICNWDRAHIFSLKKRYIHSGKSSGVSFRLAKGVYVRTGQGKGISTPVESMESLGLGSVVVTTKNLYYKDGSGHVKKLSTSNVIAVTPYIDAIGIEFERYLPLVIKVPAADLDILQMAIAYNKEYLSAD